MTRWSALEKAALAAFLFWTACGCVFTLGHFDAAAVAVWPLPGWLITFVQFCLRTGDPVLIFLAFANTHLHAARQWTPALARRWALVVVVSSLAVETLGAATGLPFGVYHYTERFGPRLGIVPLAIPLAWHVVTTNALFLVRRMWPHAPRPFEAAATGLACTLYDFCLEPFATTVKGYWHWRDGAIPPQNYLAWFFVATMLAGFLAPTNLARHRDDPRPPIILGATLILFLLGVASAPGR